MQEIDESHKLGRTLALLVAALEAWPDAQPAEDPHGDDAPVQPARVMSVDIRPARGACKQSRGGAT